MKDFEIPPLGMTPDDLAAIRDYLQRLRAQSTTFAMHYWSRERRTVLLVSHVEGEIIDWQMTPCGSEDQLPPLIEDWMRQLQHRARLLTEMSSVPGLAAIDAARRH